MSIIIKKENEKFNMYQNGELRHENLKVIVDKRKGNGIDDGDIRLPENSFGKKWLSTTLFTEDRTEIDLANIPARSKSTTTTERTPTKNWTEYLTEDEKKVYDELKTKATERMTAENTKKKFTEMAKNFTREELLAMLGMVEA